VISPATNSTLKISVVVTTYNRRHSLERCLSSLAAQDFLPRDYEIIVVADGCSDDTVELLRSFTPSCSFRWFEHSNQGQPASQNLGVAARNWRTRPLHRRRLHL
jgi:glycosyltransferase involved in cell wall biosynthesis